MVNILIEEQTLVDMLYDRVCEWKVSPNVRGAWYNFYYDRVYSGCYDGCEFDTHVIVDDDILNYYDCITAREFENYDIEDESDDRIETIYSTDDGTKLYIVSCC